MAEMLQSFKLYCHEMWAEMGKQTNPEHAISEENRPSLGDQQNTENQNQSPQTQKHKGLNIQNSLGVNRLGNTKKTTNDNTEEETGHELK